VVGAEEGPERDAVARNLAAATAQALGRHDGGLVASAAGASSAAGGVDVKMQVRFARQFHNVRGLLGPGAADVGAALLRTVLTRIDPADATPLGQGGDSTRLNDLCWFFINTAKLRGALDVTGRAKYDHSLRWFADRTLLWSVESFETTRASLAASVPIRWTLDPARPDLAEQFVVRVSGETRPLEVLRRYHRPTGRLEAIETLLSVRLDANEPRLEISSPRTVGVTASVPRYRFDPLRSTPTTEGWEPVQRVQVDPERQADIVRIPLAPASQTASLTAFQARGDRFVSPTLERQIEQMETLARLHPGHGFDARSQQWASFRHAWESRSPRRGDY
jgi:hypothetical protein